MMAALFVFSLLFRDMPIGELLLSLISLAVAAVPEGCRRLSRLFSLGVQAMARRRRLSASCRRWKPWAR
jgi:magnesium-transporting ATPase (P-type)